MFDINSKRLYKFYSYNERSLEAISSPYLWFSKIKNFNDPFEGVFSKSCEVPSENEGVRLSKKIFASRGRQADHSEKVLRDIYLSLESGSFSEFMASTFLSAFSKTKEFLLDDNGFCSLIAKDASIDNKLTTEQDILMWSHYANGLRGFRVEFDGEELITTLSEQPDVKPITYSASPPHLDIFKFTDLYFKDKESATTYFFNILFNKHQAWSYESEIRLGNSKEGKYNYSPSAIKEIVIGGKLSNEQIEIIRRLVASHKHDIPIRIANIDDSDYSLRIE